MFTVLGLFDHIGAGADHLNAEFIENTVTVEVHGGVQPRLAAKGRQQGVRPLALHDLGNDFPGDWLDVGTIGHLGIGHDRGGVGIDQDDLVTFFAQRLASLGSAVIKLTCLANDDGAGADEKDFAQVGTFWHGRLSMLRDRWLVVG